MTANNIIQAALYMIVLLVLAKPLGLFMARVYEGKTPKGLKWLSPIEHLLYRICGIREDDEMNWKTYAATILLFNVVGLFAVYLLQRFQVFLPLNPTGMKAVSSDSSFNTATSFATNTNWQGYSGEVTMSYLTQMVGLTVQNFVSAAAGMAMLVALIRGFVRKEEKTIGSFWVDLTRTVLYILVPLSIILAVLLVSQGVVQTFGSSIKAILIQPLTGEDGIKIQEQIIATGPAASQIAIKQLGTNGGGFFNVNSSHPYENPTQFSNFLEMISILLIGAALCYTFGVMVRDRRQGWALLAAMTILFVPLLVLCIFQEQQGNPLFNSLDINQQASIVQPGGNMEGKEARFGIASSAIWATATTAASNGSVNSMHDSYTPLGGLVPMFLIQAGEVIYGGVGSGLYGMLLFVIIAVFAAGLMVGRTPEYLGKKIESFEMKMASIGILVPPFAVLVGTSIAVAVAAGKAGVLNPGPHGFSEILYAFSSAGNNNGSAFAGISGNTPFYNSMLGIAMFIARYWIAIPVLAIAGSLASKKIVPPSLGTLPTHSLLFILFLAGIVVMVGALTFVPALALGPIAEHMLLRTQ
jgi:potassium-transporting ATPase potassium-binding subunit